MLAGWHFKLGFRPKQLHLLLVYEKSFVKTFDCLGGRFSGEKAYKRTVRLGYQFDSLDFSKLQKLLLYCVITHGLIHSPDKESSYVHVFRLFGEIRLFDTI